MFDSSVKFSKDRINVLQTIFFDGKLRIDTLKMVEIIGTESAVPNDTLLTAYRVYNKKFSGINIEVTEYRETYGTAIATGLMEYQFDNLKET